jgi:TusA-related sulfurtransferase
MMEERTVDARGLNCPEPVMRALKVMKETKEGVITVLVDSGTALENVSRLAKNSGWKVTINEQPDGSHRIVMEK